MGQHSQIPSLLTYFEQDNYQYIVQEFVDGLNLSEQLKQDGSFTETQIRQLLQDVLPVLEFVHSQQVIHRDIKPENIIRRKTDGQLFLVDFGIAKLMTGTAIAFPGDSAWQCCLHCFRNSLQVKPPKPATSTALGLPATRLLTQVSPFDLYSVSAGDWAF